MSHNYSVSVGFFVDIDECDPSLTLNQCSDPDTCLNTDGGHVCSCATGTKLENDGRTCTGLYENFISAYSRALDKMAY